MNYIAEIRAFYDWTTFNLIPADAQALWHALMHLNNKCAIQVNGQWLWRVEFTVANTTLESILKFSRTQLDRMRNVLIQSGRIGYRKGRGNQSGTYRLIPFDTQYVTQAVTHFVTQTDTQTVTQVWHNLRPLNNNTNAPNGNLFFGGGDARGRAGAGHDGESDEENSPDVTPDTLFLQNFGKKPTEAERSHCQVLLDRYDPEVIESAFHSASITDNKNFAYVLGIIENYRKRGVTDMGGVAEDDMRHDRQKRKRG